MPAQAGKGGSRSMTRTRAKSAEAALIRAEACLDRAQQDTRIALGMVRQVMNYATRKRQRTLGDWGLSRHDAFVKSRIHLAKNQESEEAKAP